jgi:oxygen-independent coproporphyrinogen-3 oxidase
LIFAIPDSNMENWQQTLRKAIEADVRHISTYSLTYEKNTPLEKIKSVGKIEAVDEETDRKMYEIAIKTLTSNGFEHYEISNFAKPGFECRHNIAYWKNEFYLGIGPSAASYIGNYRFENVSDINKYVECIEQNKKPTAEATKISPTEKASQTAVLNLRMIKGINLKDYQQKTGFDIYELFKQSIEKNLKLNFLRLNGDKLSLTANALPIADSILSDFAEPD